MAVYFVDSSALVKRYISETGSRWVLSLFDPVLNNDVLIAAITGVEIVAAITRRARGGSISATDATGQVIEDYPDDKYGPSCLISGLTLANRPIHLQCSYPSRPFIKIITVYEPDSKRWSNDFTIRRSSNDE